MISDAGGPAKGNLKTEPVYLNVHLFTLVDGSTYQHRRLKRRAAHETFR
jgi:hypothetical protein